MENVLSALNGKTYGNKYCFAYRDEKFIAELDYDGAVDYGWRDVIRVSQVRGKYSNVFRFKEGAYAYEEGAVKYWDDESNRFVYITDFSDLVKEITDWIDFMM